MSRSGKGSKRKHQNWFVDTFWFFVDLSMTIVQIFFWPVKIIFNILN